MVTAQDSVDTEKKPQNSNGCMSAMTKEKSDCSDNILPKQVEIQVKHSCENESTPPEKKDADNTSYTKFLSTFQSVNGCLQELLQSPNDVSLTRTEKMGNRSKNESSDHHTIIMHSLLGLVDLNEKLKNLVSDLHEQLLSSGGEMNESILESLVTPSSILKVPQYVTEKYEKRIEQRVKYSHLDTSGESTVVSGSFSMPNLKPGIEIDATVESRTITEKNNNPLVLVNSKTGFTRVLRACKKCHERKIACTGTRPCGPCMKNKTVCEEYHSTKKRRSRKKDGFMCEEQVDSTKRQKLIEKKSFCNHNSDTKTKYSDLNTLQNLNVLPDRTISLNDPNMNVFTQHSVHQLLPNSNTDKTRYLMLSQFETLPSSLSDQNKILIDRRMQPLDSSGGSNISFDINNSMKLPMMQHDSINPASFQISGPYMNPIYINYPLNGENSITTIGNPSELANPGQRNTKY